MNLQDALEIHGQIESLIAVGNMADDEMDDLVDRSGEVERHILDLPLAGPADAAAKIRFIAGRMNEDCSVEDWKWRLRHVAQQMERL